MSEKKMLNVLDALMNFYASKMNMPELKDAPFYVGGFDTTPADGPCVRFQLSNEIVYSALATATPPALLHQYFYTNVYGADRDDALVTAGRLIQLFSMGGIAYYDLRWAFDPVNRDHVSIRCSLPIDCSFNV